MNRYALMIMLIVGSLGGLVLASNYGVFDEEGVPEGTVTDPTYGTVPYYDSHTPPEDLGCWADVSISPVSPVITSGDESSILNVEGLTGAQDSNSFYAIGTDSVNPESRVNFYYDPPDPLSIIDGGNFVYEEKMMDYFDVMLYCQIRTYGGDIQNAHLMAKLADKSDYIVAEIDPNTDPTYFNGLPYRVDINGMKLEQVKYFYITGDIGSSSAIHVDRLRVFMQHGTSVLGGDWKHEVSENPEKVQTPSSGWGTKTRKNNDRHYEIYRSAGWDFTSELAARSGAKYKIADDDFDDTMNFDFTYKYEFEGEWGQETCVFDPFPIVKCYDDWDYATTQQHHFAVDMPGYDFGSEDYALEYLDLAGSTSSWDSGWRDFSPITDMEVEGTTVKYERDDYITGNLGRDLKFNFEARSECRVDAVDGTWTKCKYKLQVNPKEVTLGFAGYGFRNYDYPTIDLFEMTPNNVPQPNNFRFLVDANAHYAGASISKEQGHRHVEVKIYSDSDNAWNQEQSNGEGYDYNTWMPMWDKSDDGLPYWTTNEFAISEFDNGPYTAWVRVRDTFGHYIYDYYSFKVHKGAPSIQLVRPNTEFATISELFDVPLVVQVTAQDGYKDNGINYTLYADYDGDNKYDDDLTGKVPMEEDYFGYEHFWNTTFDPYEFGNGNYKLTYYAKDLVSEAERTIHLNLWNDPPRIYFNDHYNYMPIRQLYDYLINVSITDAEGDPFTNVSMSFYNLTEDEVLDEQVTPWYNLTNQETTGGDPTDYWQYEIDPVNFTNGEMYYLQVKVNGSYGWEYDGIYVLFERLDPLIQFLPEGTDEFRIDSFSDPASDSYYDGEDNFKCEFKVIQGNYSISNFTWYVASSSSFDNILTDGFIDFDLGTSTYEIEFDPRLIPNGKYFIGVAITNLTRTTFGPYKTRLDVNYYLFNQYEVPYIENYVFDNDVGYDHDDVVTNDYVIGKTNITYTSEPRAYNYVFDLTDSSIPEYVYSIYPEYKIFREGLSYYETPDDDISTSEKLYFEFGQRPTSDKDILQFNMKTPVIRLRDEFEKPETGETLDGREYMKIEVVLESDHYFTNVHCIYKPLLPISSAADYDYTLYILDGENWEKVDVEVKFSSDSFNQMWQFDIGKIAENGYEQLTFQIEGIKREGVDFNWGPILFTAITAGVMAGLTFYVIPTKTDFIKNSRTLRKKKWIYYLIATAITAGAGIGIFFGTSAIGATLIAYAI